MKAADFLAALRAMPRRTPEAFLDGKPLLVLSPHPDDESLGVGGLIAAACEAGTPVTVAILTDGAGSHPHSPTYPPERLIALRKSEARAAAEALGLAPGRIHHFDLPDTRAPTEGPAFDRAVDRLAALADASFAATVLVTWGHDPHCDHEAAAAMARALRARAPSRAFWFYPIWGWHLEPDAEIDEPRPVGLRLDIAPWLARKHAAIAAHASQMTGLIDDDPEGFRFTPEKLAPFLEPVETVFMVPA